MNHIPGDGQHSVVRSREMLSSAREAAAQAAKAKKRGRSQNPSQQDIMRMQYPNPQLYPAPHPAPNHYIPQNHWIPPPHMPQIPPPPPPANLIAQDPFTVIQQRLWVAPEQAAFIEACQNLIKERLDNTLVDQSELARLCDILGASRTPLEVRSFAFAFLCGLQCLQYDEPDGGRSHLGDIGLESPHAIWTPEEDAILENIICTKLPFSANDVETLWISVSDAIRSKTPLQCRRRFEQTILDISRMSVGQESRM